MRTGNDTLILNPSSATSLGTTEKVFAGNGVAALVNATDPILPAWIVTNNGVSKSAGPYDFLTYGANGAVKATYNATTLGTAAGQVVALAANATPAGNVNAFALNTEGKTITLGSNTLTIGDGTNAAGLILASGSAISGGTLAFGGSEGVIWLSGSNPTISAKITGTNGLTFAGSGSVALSTQENVSGPITIDSGTVTLAGTNIFASNNAGILMDNTKSKPAAATLAITANNQLAAINQIGNNAAITIGNGAALTIGDTVNNLSSTIDGVITESGAAVSGALTLNGSGLFDFTGGGKGTFGLVSGSSIVVNNSAQLRAAANEFVAGTTVVLNGTSQLQLAENGGQVFSDNVSGTGALHLIGGTLKMTSTGNTYTGGTIVETGSTLDITTANLPGANPNITDAGGLILFDQATNGTYTGVISDGLQMSVGPLLSRLARQGRQHRRQRRQRHALRRASLYGRDLYRIRHADARRRKRHRVELGRRSRPCRRRLDCDFGFERQRDDPGADRRDQQYNKRQSGKQHTDRRRLSQSQFAIRRYDHRHRWTDEGRHRHVDLDGRQHVHRASPRSMPACSGSSTDR